jgi:hypothetical protein
MTWPAGPDRKVGGGLGAQDTREISAWYTAIQHWVAVSFGGVHREQESNATRSIRRRIPGPHPKFIHPPHLPGRGQRCLAGLGAAYPQRRVVRRAKLGGTVGVYRAAGRHPALCSAERSEVNRRVHTPAARLCCGYSVRALRTSTGARAAASTRRLILPKIRLASAP